MAAPGSAKSTTSFDMEAKIALPSGKAVSFVAAILASSLSNAEVLLQVNVSAPAGAGADRVVNASLGVVGATGFCSEERLRRNGVNGTNVFC